MAMSVQSPPRVVNLAEILTKPCILEAEDEETDRMGPTTQATKQPTAQDNERTTKQAAENTTLQATGPVGDRSREQSPNAQYREEYRSSFIPPSYKGKVHFLFTASVSLLVIWACLNQLENTTTLQWLAIPLTFLYANFAEWAGHKYVMHRPRKGLKLIYERHSHQHHRFFTHEHMEMDGERDFKAVLFPPVLVTFFLLAFFVPFGVAVTLIFGGNVAMLAVATGMAYFLNYELLHFSYHLPKGHWVHSLPGFNKLMQLHESHHNPRLMAHKNFNITYPITDWIMGTWDRNPQSTQTLSPRRSAPDSQ